jgi:hypothetical protein
VDDAPDPSLDAAYRATRYVLDLPAGPLVLRVGEPAPVLDAWLAGQGFAVWAWLTAFNPGSQRLGDDENARRQAALKSALASRSLPWIDGRALADNAGWPDESSVLVPGLPCADALALAGEFGQAAILCGRVGEPPALVWLRQKA